MSIHKKFREMMYDTYIYYEFDIQVTKDRNNRCETKWVWYSRYEVVLIWFNQIWSMERLRPSGHLIYAALARNPKWIERLTPKPSPCFVCFRQTSIYFFFLRFFLLLYAVCTVVFFSFFLFHYACFYKRSFCVSDLFLFWFFPFYVLNFVFPQI